MKMSKLLQAISEIDPQKITIAAVKKMLRCPTWYARLLCNMASKQGKFVKVIDAQQTYYKLNEE